MKHKRIVSCHINENKQGSIINKVKVMHAIIHKKEMIIWHQDVITLLLWHHYYCQKYNGTLVFAVSNCRIIGMKTSKCFLCFLTMKVLWIVKNVRMAERSKAPDSRDILFTWIEWAFWSTNVGVGSNPTSDKTFYNFLHLLN